MMILQRETQAQTRLRKQIDTRSTLDMFGADSAVPNIDYIGEEANRQAAKAYLLLHLADEPLLIDNECWARFLQESNLYPSELQMAMKELIDLGLVKNLDADVRSRRTQFVKPHWPQKSERWHIATDQK